MSNLRRIGMRFEAWSLSSESGRASLHSTHDLLTEAVEKMTAIRLHKERFAVKSINDLTGEVLCHFYQVRQQSRAVWDGKQNVRKLYAEPLLTVRLNDLNPFALESNLA